MQYLKPTAAILLLSFFPLLSSPNKRIQNSSLLDHRQQSPFNGVILLANRLVSGDRAIDADA